MPSTTIPPVNSLSTDPAIIEMARSESRLIDQNVSFISGQTNESSVSSELRRIDWDLLVILPDQPADRVTGQDIFTQIDGAELELGVIYSLTTRFTTGNNPDFRAVQTFIRCVA